MQRNVICISDMPSDLQQWVKEEAKRRAEAAGKKRYAEALVYQEAVRLLKAKQEGNHSEPAATQKGQSVD